MHLFRSPHPKLHFLRVRATLILIGLLLTLTGCFSSANALIPNTVTPGPTAAPTLTPAPTQPLTATAVPTINLTPSATSALVAAATSNTDATLGATFSPSPAAVQPGDPPPFAITLPTRWRSTYTRVTVQDQFSRANVNIAAYAGPLANNAKGTGFIYVLWNFPSVMPANPAASPLPAAQFNQQMLLSDGIRLLRGTVIDISCIVGNYGQTSFKVGGQDAIGQHFQVTGCQDGTPELAGWYAGLRLNGRSLLFYSYVDPVSAYNNGQADLQKVLDSVDFNSAPVISATPAPATATPSTTPELS